MPNGHSSEPTPCRLFSVCSSAKWPEHSPQINFKLGLPHRFILQGAQVYLTRVGFEVDAGPSVGAVTFSGSTPSTAPSNAACNACAVTWRDGK